MIQNNRIIFFILGCVLTTKEFNCAINSDYKIKTPLNKNNPNGTTNKDGKSKFKSKFIYKK